MKDVKTSTSRNYREYLISSLKDTQEAAAYIETFLELEEGFEPELLRSALKDILDARLRINNLSEEAKQHYKKLDRILLETGGTEIYSLIELLNALGFRIAIALRD